MVLDPCLVFPHTPPMLLPRLRRGAVSREGLARRPESAGNWRSPSGALTGEASRAQAVLRLDLGSRAVTGSRAPALMISARSSSLKRRCLPTNVQGIKRAVALVLSQDSRTLR